MEKKVDRLFLSAVRRQRTRDIFVMVAVGGGAAVSNSQTRKERIILRAKDLEGGLLHSSQSHEMIKTSNMLSKWR